MHPAVCSGITSTPNITSYTDSGLNAQLHITKVRAIGAGSESPFISAFIDAN